MTTSIPVFIAAAKRNMETLVDIAHGNALDDDRIYSMWRKKGSRSPLSEAAAQAMRDFLDSEGGE